MITTLGETQRLSAIARTAIFSINVPSDETWVILTFRTPSDNVQRTYAELRINQDPRIQTIPSPRNHVLLLNEVIQGGTNIQIDMVKETVDAQTVSGYIDVERIKK